MKKCTIAAGVAGLLLSGCMLPTWPVGAATAPAAPAGAGMSLEGQSRVLRTKIVQLKQEVRVFEGMLTDVERRAAMSQVSVSSFPNTEAVPGASAAVDPRPAPDRLSVTVRPAPDGPPPARPGDNRNARVPQR